MLFKGVGKRFIKNISILNLRESGRKYLNNNLRDGAENISSEAFYVWNGWSWKMLSPPLLP